MLLGLALLLQQGPANRLPVIDHPGTDPMLAADIRALCPSIDANTRDLLLKLEQQQARPDRLKNDRAPWIALGCTRARLSELGAISHESAAMVAGDSWGQGAMKALEQALTLGADRRAADLLAVLAMNEPEPRDLEPIAIALDRAAAGGAGGSATLRACADFGLRSGHPDITRRCATHALKDGKDSTWHSLLLARLDFRNGDTVAGVRAFIQAAGAAHDTLATLAMGWHLQWFVSPGERKSWGALGDGSRDAWVRNLLAARDIRDARPPGARLAEHFKRLDHVDSAFRLSVAKVLRTSLLTRPSTGFAGSGPPGGFLPPGGAAPSDQATMLLEQPFRDYMRWQIDWDDRGVTWMRFGEPLKVAVAPEIEVWYYEIDGKPLLVTFAYEKFAGTAAPSRLITGHIGDVYCGIDSWRCALGMRQGIPADLILQVKEQDREYIAAATTRDDNSVRTEKSIEVISRLHRLWDPVSGMPVALLTYALKAGDLVVPREGADQTARVEFEFRRWDPAEDRFRDTTFTRRFNTSIDKLRHLTGYFVTPSPTTVSSWSLVARQSENRRGRAWDDRGTPLDSGEVALSDLVLGQAGQGVTWTYHNTEIPLAPLNAVDRRQPVSLYYQIRSNGDMRAVRTIIALYRTESVETADTAALQVGFDQAMQRGVNEVEPSLDVTRLAKGKYRLDVRLEDDRGVLISKRAIFVTLDE